jgi:hypothetical protein
MVFAGKLTSRFGSRTKDARRSPRRRAGSKAWIRADGGFSVRPCKIADLSATGVRLVLDTPQAVSGQFNLLFTRDAGLGRRCRVRWRRGTQLGAEFL